MDGLTGCNDDRRIERRIIERGMDERVVELAKQENDVVIAGVGLTAVMEARQTRSEGYAKMVAE